MLCPWCRPPSFPAPSPAQPEGDWAQGPQDGHALLPDVSLCLQGSCPATRQPFRSPTRPMEMLGMGTQPLCSRQTAALVRERETLDEPWVCMAVLAHEKGTAQELAKNTLSHFGVSLGQSYLWVTSALSGARTSRSSPPPGFGQPPPVPSYMGLSGQHCGDSQRRYLSPQRALQSAFSPPLGMLQAGRGRQALSSAQGLPHSRHPHPLFAKESKQQRYALS